MIQYKTISEESRKEEAITDTEKQKGGLILFFRKRWKFLLGIFVTMGLMVFLILTSNPREIVEAFKGANIVYVVLAILSCFGLFLIKTVRWQYILRIQGYKIPFFETLKLVLIGTFGSSVTPAKVGDVLRAYYLSQNKKQIAIGESVFSVVFDRILDLGGIFIVLLIAAPVILLTQGNLNLKWWMIVGFVGGIMIFISLAVFSFSKKISKPIICFILKYISKMFKKQEAKNKISITADSIIEDFFIHQKKFTIINHLILGILSLVFWTLLGLQGCAILKAFNAKNIAPIVVIASISFAAIAAMAIPVSISGIGVRDAIIVNFLFLFLDILQPISLSLTIFQTFLNVLLPGLIGAILMIILTSKIAVNKRKKIPIQPV